MKPNLRLIVCSLAVAAGLVSFSLTAQAQDVVVTGSLTDVPAAGGVYDYTLTLNNTGIEAVQALWLGWYFTTVGVFDIQNPSNPSSQIGWKTAIVGPSIEFGPGTPLAPGASTEFFFDSTSTPIQFQNGSAGTSVAYGVDASFTMGFPIEDTTLHSEEFTPTVATPEPSIATLLAAVLLPGVGCKRLRHLFLRR